MKFNINNYVKVKLTPYGKEVYLRYYRKFGFDKELPKEDEDGYYKIQLWSLMNIYGSCMYMCGKLPFETDIIICEVG